MTTAGQWLEGARPRTLPAAVAPVLVGSGAAGALGAFRPGRAALALLVALAMQVGVNYANDYSDGVRGTDAHRVGPLRLVGSGVASPARVKAAALVCFGLAAAAGLVLAVLTTLWLVLLGAVLIAAAWGYTGGTSPYGYPAAELHRTLPPAAASAALVRLPMTVPNHRKRREHARLGPGAVGGAGAVAAYGLVDDEPRINAFSPRQDWTGTPRDGRTS